MRSLTQVYSFILIFILSIDFGYCNVDLFNFQPAPTINRQSDKSTINNKILTMMMSTQTRPGGNPAFQFNQTRVANSNNTLNDTQEFEEIIDTFTPQCDPRQLKTSPTELIKFAVIYPDVMKGRDNLRVADARLRLFISQPADNSATAQKRKKDYELACEFESRYRITVSYVHMRYRKVVDSEMLDSSMVNYNYSGWISFNVIGAVRNWYINKNKAAAILIEMEDTRKTFVNVRDFISTRNCTNVGEQPRLILVSQLYPVQTDVQTDNNKQHNCKFLN